MLKWEDIPSWWIGLIPVLYLLLYSLQFSLFDAFYSSRIDPEYVYLLNGLTVAEWKMTRIGHIDHPGTPFQVYTGLMIRLSHLVGGKEDLATDVFARPEWYLRNCSHSLAVFLSILTLLLGRWAYRSWNTGWAMVLQLIPVLSPMVWMMQTRYTPDRFNILLALCLLLLLLEKIDTPEHPHKRTLWVTGILCGLSVAVKITFLPILIIPLLYWWEGRTVMLIAMATGFLLGVIPVLGRMDTFTGFVGAMATHQGAYGTGEAGILHLPSILINLSNIFQQHLLIPASLCATIAILILGRKNASIPEIRLKRYHFGLLLATTLTLLMVSKHYKNYYLGSLLVFAAAGVILSVWWLCKHQLTGIWFRFIFGISFSGLLLHSGNEILQEWNHTRQKQKEMRALTALLKQHRSERPHTFIITPDWLQGPAVEYGLVYGISWVRHRFKYQQTVESIYPNVLSFEGPDRPMRSMRLDSVATADIFNQQQPFLVLNSPNRPAEPVHNYLARLARDNEMQLQVDTTYFDPDIYFVSIQTK